MSLQSEIQAFLDKNLDIPSFYQVKGNIKQSTRDYVVYSFIRAGNGFYVDDKPLLLNTIVVIRYFYKRELIQTATGRQEKEKMEDKIRAAIINSDYTLSSDCYDVGDIDDNGYLVSVFEMGTTRVMGDDGQVEQTL